jgi:hypothetical protein
MRLHTDHVIPDFAANTFDLGLYVFHHSGNTFLVVFE